MLRYLAEWVVAALRHCRTYSKVLAAGGRVVHGRGLHVGVGTRLWAPRLITIGREVYIGKHVTIECDCVIGDFVLIANRVGIVGRKDHDFRVVGVPVRLSPWVGDKTDNDLQQQTVVEQDVWLGYGATVLSGVRIGRGSVVAAGALVVRDVPPYAVVSGNPAIVIGERMPVGNRAAHEYSLQHGSFRFSERGSHRWTVQPKLPD